MENQSNESPVSEIVINGDHYICPSSMDVTCGEYDNFVQWVKSLPKITMPPSMKKRAWRHQKKWSIQADRERSIEIAAYWWGLPASAALSCDEAGQNIILNLAMEAIRDDSQHAAATLHIDDQPYHLDLKVMKQCASLAEVLGLCLKDASGNNLGLKAAQNIPLPIARPVLNRIASIGLVVNGGAGKIIHDKVLYGKE